MSIFKKLKDRKLTASDKLIFVFLADNPNSTYTEICQQLELSINTVKAGLKKLKECNLIDREKIGRKCGTKIVLCQSDKKSIWYKNCAISEAIWYKIWSIFTYNFYYGTKFVPYYKDNGFLLKSDSYSVIWYKNCAMLWDLERKEAKERSIYIYKYINSINVNKINIEEGKSSLTSFASTSRRNFTTNSEIVNDLCHENLNQIKKDQISDFALTPLFESLPVPAKQKKPRKAKAKAQFNPPTVEEVEEYMKQYVDKKSHKIPKLLTLDLAVISEQFIARYSDDWSEVKNWKNKTITFLCNQTLWNKNQKGYATKKRKNQEAIEEIFGKGLEPENNIIDAIQTQDANGSVLYDASTSNQITAQPAAEADKTELSAAEYIRRFKLGEIK